MTESATLIEVLDAAVARDPARAFLSAREGLRYRYWSTGELRESVGRFAGHLTHTLSLPRGSRVMICAPNSPRTVIAHLGTMLAGMIVVPLDSDSADGFVGRVAEKTEASLLLAAGRAFSLGPPAVNLDTFAFDEAPTFQGPGPSAEDIAEIVFTSGTTGDPKGTVLTHANIVANVVASAEIFPPEVPMRLLSILPLSHMLEQTGGLYLPLYRDGTVHYAGSRQPQVIARELARSRACAMIVVPRVLEIMLAAIERAVDRSGRRAQWRTITALASRLPIDARRYLFPAVHRQFGGRLLYFMCGGATLPADLVQGWETLGIRIVEGYGSTECSPVIASNTYNDRRKGTVGLPLPGFETRLSDDGELLVRGASVSSGYWKDSERTQAAFSPTGWFHTGDIVSRDADGALRIVARLNDRIVLGNGQKVFPADVEAELAKEPGIIDCVVLALPDPQGADRINAVVRAQPDASADQIAAAVRNANSRLAGHQAIAAYTLWPGGDFPRTDLGKVKRNAVRAELLAKKADKNGTPAIASISRGDRVRHILAEITGKSLDAISETTDLSDDLAVDSLQRLELAAKIEATLGVELGEDSLAETRTVAELIQAAEASNRQDDANPPMRFAEWPLGSAAIATRAGLQRAALLPSHGLLGHPFRVTGQEHLKEVAGPVLVIANHSSHIDTISIVHALPPELRRTLAIAAAADYFYRHKVAGSALSLLLNTFPFSRGGHVNESLERCGELIDRGWSILIYPEGTRSPDGSLLPFKSGIGVLAKGLNVPIVPVAVEGGRAILPKGARWPRRAPVWVRIGASLRVDPNASPAEITEQLRDCVLELMEQSK